MEHNSIDVTDLIIFWYENGYIEDSDISKYMDETFSSPIDLINAFNNQFHSEYLDLYYQPESFLGTNSKSSFQVVYAKIIEKCPTMRYFIDEINRIEPLSKEEVNYYLFELEVRDAEGRELITKFFMKYAIKYAFLFSEKHNIDVSDCIQNALVGLVEAISSYTWNYYDDAQSFLLRVRRYIYNELKNNIEVKNSCLSYPSIIKRRYASEYEKIYYLDQDLKEGLAPGDWRIQYINEMLHIGSEETCYAIVQAIMPSLSWEQLIEKEYDTYIPLLGSIAEDDFFRNFLEEYEAVYGDGISDLSYSKELFIDESSDMLPWGFFDKAGLTDSEILIFINYNGLWGDNVTFGQLAHWYNISYNTAKRRYESACRKIKKTIIEMIMEV